MWNQAGSFLSVVLTDIGRVLSEESLVFNIWDECVAVDSFVSVC